MSLDILDIVVFFAFLSVVVAVGLIKSKGENDSSSYFLAGRGLSWWIIGISLIAANISTEQFVGMSGSASGITGLAVASYEWMAAITLVCVAFLFLPKFLKSGMYTLPQFLEYRYDGTSRTLMSVLMVVVLVCVNITAVVYSGAIVAESFFRDITIAGMHLNVTFFCWAIAIVAAIYVCAGGLKACAWADLIQGTALVLGGAIIAYFAFDALAAKPVAEIASTMDLSPERLAELKDAGVFEKFFALNSNKLTMFLPSDHPEIPWTALIIGLWIPNFYYWGFNQYIIQRTLGASSLAEGQKGIIFAAALKLVIPFIIVIPGIIAFNLFANEQRAEATRDIDILEKNARAYAYVHFDSLESSATPISIPAVVNFFTVDIEQNDKKINKQVLSEKAVEGLLASYNADKASGTLKNYSYKFDKGWEESHPQNALLVKNWNEKYKDSAVNDPVYKKTLYGYKYDSAFALLIKNLLPESLGLRGFILAALLGAVVSSLASMLNAASTIFSIDIFQKLIAPNTSEQNVVLAGRIGVIVFAVIGCFIAPALGMFDGIFSFIQEFQGYISPGILSVFLFGMFSKRAPRFSGVVGIVSSPIIYGILHMFFSDIAFLNRMAITFACCMILMATMTILKPLKQDIVMNVDNKMDLSSSKIAKIGGWSVLIATACLYFVFSGLFIN